MGWNDLIDSQLGDRYQVIGEIARGGMSRVYRAHDQAEGRDVAIKIMVLGSDGGDPRGFTKRFEHEARAVERLDHPNIVKVYDTGESDDFVYIVMQLVTGGTFRSRLGRPLAVADACAMAIQMAQALNHAHRHNVIHRDVKPANMLLDDHDPHHLLLADFGIAKIIGQKGVTKTGTAVGTPEYMAPEQAKGEEIDPRADIYGLACVLYEAMAGRPPFVGPTALSICYQHVHTRPAYIRGFNPEVPRALALIIEQALAKNPNDRFPDAEAFAIALHPFTEPAGVVVRRSRPLTSPLRDGDGAGLSEAINNSGTNGGRIDLPGFMAPSRPLEPIAPLGEMGQAPVLDLSRLAQGTPIPPRTSDLTQRQTQEITPLATPARPRHTHPTNPGVPRTMSRPLTTPRTDASLPDIATYSTTMTPVAPDVAGMSTVQAPVASVQVASATPSGGYPPERPTRRPAGRSSASSSLIAPQPRGRAMLILGILAVALTLFVLLILSRFATAGTSTTVEATVTTMAPSASATTTPLPTTIATPTVNIAALAIARATLSAAQDLTCGAASNRTLFDSGATVYINACVAKGYGPGTVAITIYRADGILITTKPFIDAVPDAGPAAYYNYYPGLPNGNYFAKLTWNDELAMTLPFTVGK